MARNREPIYAGVAAASVTLIVGALFAWLGILNGDEGWYGLAAQAIGRGQLPYRDFALVQGPVYPTLLAPFVLLWPSILMTRALSVFMMAAAVGILIYVAWRIGGRVVGLFCCAALLATIPSLPYWLSITKTYALCFLLLSIIIYLLIGGPKPQIGYPAAALVAVVLVATRTTGIAIAIPLIGALILRAPDRLTRWRIAIITTVASLPLAVLLVFQWERLRWSLYDYHKLSLEPMHGFGKYLDRSIGAARAWPGPIFLGCVALAVALCDPQLRAILRRRLDLTALAVGFVLFVLLHQSGAMFFTEEYLSPLIAILLVGSCIILLRYSGRPGANVRWSVSHKLRMILIFGIALTAVTGGHSDFLGAPGWKGSVSGLDQIIRCIKNNSTSNDTVFAMNLEEVVLQSHRRPVSGVSLGVFSLQDIAKQKAQDLRIMNNELLVNTFVNRPPKVLVLTPFDFSSLSRGGWFSDHFIDQRPLQAQLRNYRQVCSKTVERNVFDNKKIKVLIFARISP